MNGVRAHDGVNVRRGEGEERHSRSPSYDRTLASRHPEPEPARSTRTDQGRDRLIGVCGDGKWELIRARAFAS